MPRPCAVFFPAFLLLTAGLAQAEPPTDGAEVYRQVCAECHESGKLGAPRLDDGKRWKKLIREGLNDLVPAALGGIRQMPARGGKPELSDLAVARAVIYMTNRHGANFAEPTPQDLQRWRQRAERRKK